MKNQFIKNAIEEPYRIFFPAGILYVLAGTLLWLPLLWNPANYPVLIHRALMLNGFAASFIGGFLMTAVPKFSKTHTANVVEISFYFLFTIAGLISALMDNQQLSFIFSGLQAATILLFLLTRVMKRKENPPYSFVFIFVGLFLWLISAMINAFQNSNGFIDIHYEGAIASIILGVGARLVPGILGHNEIVLSQRARYETPKPFLLTVPFHFYGMILIFIASYFFPGSLGNFARAIIVSAVAIFYWKLFTLPKTRTALTYSIWTAAWLIVASFWLKIIWADGFIHASHSFFINGIALLSLLISTRVLQSHGPKDSTLENLKLLYVVTTLMFLSSILRVVAILTGDYYYHFLGCSSLIFVSAILLWAVRYLKYVTVKKV